MKSFTLGLLLGMSLISCAAAPVFPYRFFHASPAAVWDFPTGKLLGEKPQDDRLLTDCKPVFGVDPQGKPVTVQKCVIMFYDELKSLIIDYKKTKTDLDSCQKGQKNGL